MRDPKPVLLLLCLQGLGLMLLAGWWAMQPADERVGRLVILAVQEQAPLPPPRDLLGQAQWLRLHRQQTGQGLLGLLAVGLLIGVGEGLATRAQDPLKGFRLTRWTCGVVGLALVPGLVAAYLFLPWPLPLRLVGGGGGGWLAVMGWCLCAGKPYIA